MKLAECINICIVKCIETGTFNSSLFDSFPTVKCVMKKKLMFFYFFVN